MDKEHFFNVCLPGRKELTCKYIGGSPDGIICMKLRPDLRVRVEGRTDMTAQGDNCEGDLNAPLSLNAVDWNTGIGPTRR
jgi:hypothetical protein